MEDLRIYDFDFHLLHIQHKFQSVNWTVYYNKIGTFEAHFPAEERCVSLLFEQDYLVVVQGEKQAVCTGKQVRDGEVILYGKTVNFLLSKRVVLPFKTSQTEWVETPEEIVRNLVREAFLENRTVLLEDGTSRLLPRVENFVMGPATGIIQTESHFWRTAANPLSEVVSDLLDSIGGGHRLVFDREKKQWRFEVYMGKENPLVISGENKNAAQVVYTEDAQDYAGSGWYEKQGAEDEDSQWFFVPGGEETPLCRWEAPLSGGSRSEAHMSLAAKKRLRKNQCETRSLVWGADYDLGDLVWTEVCVGNALKRLRQRVVGVNVWYESEDLGEEPILENGG